MSMTEVGIRLSLEGQQAVQSGINNVNGQLGKLDSGARQAATGAETLKTAMAGLVTVGAVTALIKMADAATTLQTQLRLSSNSAAEATKAYGALFNIAQQGRVSFTELGNTYASIARAGKELGVSQTRLLDVTKSISQAMTIGGGSAASMQAALVQLGQGLSSGVLRGEELNSIMEQTPRLAQAIADGLGVPIGKLRDLGAAGELTAQQVMGALEKAGPALAKEMESATLTVGQAFTMLGNSAMKFTGDADKASGASAALASVLKDVSGAIDTVGSAINNNQAAFAAISGGLGGAAAVAGLAAVAANIGKIRVAFLSLGAAMAANPVTLTIMGIGAVVGGAYAMIDARAKTLDAMKAELAKLESSTGTGLYGGKASDAAITKRLQDIDRLRGSITELETASGKYANAEDKRLAEHTQGYKAEQAQIEKISDLLAKSSSVPDAYIKRMKEIQGLSASMSPDELTTALDAAHKLLPKVAAATAKLSDEQKLVNAGLAYYNDLMAEESGYSKTFTEDVTKLAAAYQASGMSADEYRAALDKIIANQPFSVALAKEQKKAFEDQAKATDKATVAYGKYLDELEMRNADTDQIGIDYEKATKGMQDYANLEESLMGQSAQAREDALAQYKAERDLAAEILKIRQAGGNQETIDANIAKVTVSATDRAAVESQKKYVADWNKTYDRIESGLVDALMKGGKEGAQGVRDLLVQELFSRPFQMVIQALVQPIAGALTNAAMGTSGGTGSTMDMVSGMASLSDKMGNLAGAFNGSGLANLATSSMGQSLGLSTAATFGNNASAYVAPQLTSAGSALSATPIGGILAAYQVGGVEGFATGVASTAVAGAVSGLAAGTGALAGATAALAAIPVYGWIALGAAAILGMDEGGGPKTEASYGPGAGLGDTSATGFAGKYATGIESAWGDLAKTLELTNKLVAGTEISIDTLGEDLTNFTAYAALDGNVISDRRTRMGGMDAAQVGRSEQELADAMALETSYILFEALQASDIGAQAKAYLGEVDASLTSMVNDADRVRAMGIGMENLVVIHNFQEALENLPFEYLAGLSFNAAKGLIEAAGGLDKLGSNLTGFYDNFYSADEKFALLTTNTAKSFESLGLVMPAIDESLRETYRAEVERLGAMDLSVEANARAYAGALALQGGVDTLADTFDATAKVTQDWQDKIDLQSGKTTQLEQERAAALAVANDATDILINKYYDSATAAEKAAEAIATNTAWGSILTARGQNGDSYATQKSIDGAFSAVKEIDPSMSMDGILGITEDAFRALGTEMQALVAGIIADTATLGAALKGFQSEAANLSVELLTAQGDTAGATKALRDLGTEGLDAVAVAAYDYNQSLRDQISAYGTLKTVTDKYAKDLTLRDAETQITSAMGPDILRLTQAPDIKAAILDYAKLLSPLTVSGRAAIEQLSKLTPALDLFIDSTTEAASKAAEAAKKATADKIGFDAAGLASMLTSAISKANPQAAADAFAVALESSVRNALMGSVISTISESIYNAIITPILMGAAVSEATTAGVIDAAKSQIGALTQVLSSDAFKGLLATINEAVMPVTSAADALAPAADSAAAAVNNLAAAANSMAGGFDFRVNLDGLKQSIKQALSFANNTYEPIVYTNGFTTDPNQGATNALTSIGSAVTMFFGHIKTAAQTTAQIVKASDSAIGDALNQNDMADYFENLGSAFTDFAELVKSVAQDAATAIGGLSTSAFDTAIFNNTLGSMPGISTANAETISSIGAGASAVGAAITQGILNAIPEAVKNSPALAGVSTEILAVIGSVTEGDLQGLGDSFNLLSGELASGALTADQYTAAIKYINGAYLSGTESLTDAAAEDLNAAAEERKSIELELAGMLGNTSLARERELDALDETNRSLKLHVYALQDADTAVDAALSAVQRAVDAERTRIQDEADAQIEALQTGIDDNQDAVDAATKAVDSLNSIFGTITDAVKALRNEVDEQTTLLQARSYIDMTLSLAKAGSMPDEDQAQRLQDAISVVTQDSADMYSAQSDYVYAQLVQAGKLDELGTLVGEQKTIDQQQLDALTAGNKSATDQIKAIQDAATAQIDALDLQLIAAQDAVSVMHGIDISILSIASAITGLNTALLGLANARTDATDVSGVTGTFPTTATSVAYTDAQIRAGYAQMYSGIDLATANSDQEKVTDLFLQLSDIDALGGEAWRAAVAAGGDGLAAREAAMASAIAAAGLPADILETQHDAKFGAGKDVPNAAMNDLARVVGASQDWYDLNNAKFPGYAVGTNYVPSDGLAYLHEGEAIIPKAYNPAAGGNSNARLEALLEGVTKEVQRLQAIVNDGNKSNQRTADAVNGRPEQPMLVETV